MLLCCAQVKRTQIQLDDETYEALRQRAHEERRSISALIREALTKSPAPGRRRLMRLQDFRFVGSGRSRRVPWRPVSEQHDAALAEAFVGARKRRR